MRVALHRVESDCLKTIYDNMISKEETLDLVVPDVSADIGRILDVRGQFLLSSQKARNDEIHISASVEVSVVYAAEDSGKVQYVMANIPFDMSLPLDGADEDTKLVTRWELCGLEARMLNPRKLLLRANVSAHIVAFAPDKFVLWDNLSEEEKTSVCVLKKEVGHTLVVGVREKSFTVSDEYRLPADKDQNAKMLSASTEICVQDVKAVGNKIVIKAVSKTVAVFVSENDGSLFDCLFSTMFSQIIEVDTFGDNITNSVGVWLKDAEFTMVNGKENGFICSASLQICAQTVSREAMLSTYAADAYSNEFSLNAETAETKMMRCIPTDNLMLDLKGRIKPKSTLTEIMYAGVAGVCTETQGDEIRLNVNISGVGRTESGELEAIELKLSSEEIIELSKGQRLNISSVCCDKPVITGSAQNAEISVGVEIKYCIKETFEIDAVCCIEIREDCPINKEDRPSLVVLCAERETDLWSLAKKYGSTMEMIENANIVNGEFSVRCRPLLIPRAK